MIVDIDSLNIKNSTNEFKTKEESFINNWNGVKEGQRNTDLVSHIGECIKKAMQVDVASLILKESSNALKEMGFSLMFMAMTVAKFSKDKIILSSAGMPFSLLYRFEKNAVEELEVKGMPMGSMKDFPYKSEEVNLKSGDVILFMSDGFPELFNEDNDMLGYDKAVEIFNEAANKKSGDVIQQLINEAKSWAGNYPLKDDITFVVVKIK
ncbi:MAG: serine/threonine-protein phosphatase [Bacteroidetes bacterium]|nr:serine/threonine-protein phosphatase [Bacteroidota bacterium]